jgi:hypothetical protein
MKILLAFLALVFGVATLMDYEFNRGVKEGIAQCRNGEHSGLCR